MKMNEFTKSLETMMQNLPNQKIVRSAVASVLFSTAAMLSAADAPAKQASPEEAAQELRDTAAKELVTREQNEKDAAAARDAGRKLFEECKYREAIDQFLLAKKIWEGQNQITPAKYERDIEAMRKEVANAYYYWAKELHASAEQSAKADQLDDAIAKCKQAMEMYPPSKQLMEEAIAKYEKQKRSMEFKEKTKYSQAVPDAEEQQESIELKLERGRTYFKLGRLDDARAQFNEVIAVEPYNDIAIDYLRRIYLKAIQVGRQRKGLTAAEATNEAAWKLVAPVLLNASQEGDEDTAVSAVAKVNTDKSLQTRLQNIKFKTLVFEETPLDEVVKFLCQKSRELDPDKKPVNFVLRFNAPATSATTSEDGEEGEGGGGEEAHTVEMPPITIYFGSEGGEDNANAEEISLGKVIDAICKGAELNYRVDEHAVVISPKEIPLDDLVTEFYTVEKEAMDAAGADDPKAYFEARGIKFPESESARAIYDEKTNKLIVTNTPAEQLKIAQEVQSLNQSDPQVQLQVKFVEISMNDLEELGFQYVISRPTTTSSVADGEYLGTTLDMYTKSESSGEDGSTVTYTPKTFVNSSGNPISLYTISHPQTGETLGSASYVNTYESDRYVASNAIKNGEKYWIGGTSAIEVDAASVAAFEASTEMQTKWYRTKAADQYDGHRVTFQPNDEILRNVQNNYTDYGLDTSRNDTVFNWSHYSSSGYNFNAQIHALDQADSTDILSSPRVTTMNGNLAKIKMVTKKFYPESWGDSELNDVNGLSVFVPSTPEFGEAKEEGISLEVTPNIADEEKYTLEMQMNPVILDFAGWTDYSYTVLLGDNNEPHQNILKMPIIEARSVQTAVVCYDKSTIVLGGIVKDKVSDIDDQYPILGDIPILGRLFQSKGKNSQKTNLLIFLTASLVNSDGTLFRPEGTERGVPTF